ATVAFVLGKQFFFGSSMQGLSLYPFAITLDTQHQYPALDHSTGFSEFGVHIALTFSYLMGYLTLGVAACSLLVRRGWLKAETIFLLMTCLAGLGAGFSFQQQGGSEGYFIYVILLPLLLAAVMGLHRVLPEMDRRSSRIVGSSIVVGWAAATIYEASVPGAATD
ncbi:MAG TPA: hypothetical protein VN108_03750, partial [Marmoricola sp.]|nr:hypothetical protein [Marmoricola sp.]